MKQWISLSMVSAVVLTAALSANAQTTLTEILFNEDGTAYDQFPSSTAPISAPGVKVTSGFGVSSQPGFSPFYLNGLGTLQYTVTGTGVHNFIGFVDDEADYVNGPFQDSGAIVHPGSAPGYLSWEIGNPESTGTGSIGNNAAGSAPGSDLLNDANDVPAGNTDIAFALGFDFTLKAGQKATIDLSLSSTAPTSGFYLQQFNGNDNFQDQDYYSGSLTITGTTQGVPDDGATWISMLLGLTVLAVMTGFERKFSLKRAA